MNKIYSHNCQILSKIEPGTKLLVDKSDTENKGKLYIDDRYIQSVRRWYTNDSRLDIIEPINLALDYFNNSVSKIGTRIIASHILKVFQQTYPDFVTLHEQIENYIKCKKIIIDNFNWNNITNINSNKVLIESQQYCLEKSGFVLITLIGGGAGGGIGGTCNRGGGGSGYILSYLCHFKEPINLDIKIGDGGEGGYKKGSSFTPPTSGKSTYVIFGKHKLFVNGGSVGKKSINGGCGFNGGGSGSNCSIVGGAGGTNGLDGTGVDCYIGGEGYLSNKSVANNFETFFKLLPIISFGQGGVSESYDKRFIYTNINQFYNVSGGGGGGFIIEDNAPLVKASDPIPLEIYDNNTKENIYSLSGMGHCGLGFGAGGGGGAYIYNVVDKKYLYGNGSNGASGCVIISYVDNYIFDTN